MSDAMPEILALGEAMVEFNQVDERRYVRGFGGDTSNAAICAARQGARVGYLTRVGRDRFGDALCELWHSENVDTRWVERADDAPTGIYFVDHDADGHHFSYYRQGSAAARMQPRHLDEAAIAAARVLHVSAISQAISESASETVEAAIEMARNNGCLVSYDTNLRLNLWSLERAREVIHRAIARADIALPSYDDARLLCARDDADAIVDYYRELGASIVLLKLGARGLKLWHADERLDIPAFAVSAIDANAAGDTFAGAFLAQFLRSGEVTEAARYACAAAALSTTASGAVTSIPGRARVEAFLDEHGDS